MKNIVKFSLVAICSLVLAAGCIKETFPQSGTATASQVPSWSLCTHCKSFIREPVTGTYLRESGVFGFPITSLDLESFPLESFNLKTVLRI